MRKNSLTRIKGSNVQIGSSFVLPLETNQLKDIEIRIKKMLADANAQKELLINEGAQKAKELVEEAKQIIEQAQIESEKLIETAKNQAQEESDAIREQARQEGYDAGNKQGYEDGTRSLEEKVKAVDIFSKSQFDIKHNIIKSAELDIVDLVIAIAKKVCKKTLDDDINVLKTITEDAIKQLKDKESITITIHPDLAEKIYSISEELKVDIPKLEHIKVIEDINVSPDGTIVETPLSRVDCRLQTQLNQIAEKLMETHYSAIEENEEETIDEAIEEIQATEDEIQDKQDKIELLQDENLDNTKSEMVDNVVVEDLEHDDNI